MNKNNYKNILMALLLMLIALPTAMMAQTNSERYMVVTENDGTVTVFNFDEIESVTWGVPQPLPGTFGTAKATINGNQVDVPWVQLWEDGPKFAEYNVGVTDGKAESFGGYYCWGRSFDKEVNYTLKYSSDLVSSNDTATQLWGSAWRMPTRAEFDGFHTHCNMEWTTVNGVIGRRFTGKGDYSSNSIFFPCTGYFSNAQVSNEGRDGFYWSSTHIKNNTTNSYSLDIVSGGTTSSSPRGRGQSVRAVLAE